MWMFANPSILVVSNPLVARTIIYLCNCIMFMNYLKSDKTKGDKVVLFNHIKL